MPLAADDLGEYSEILGGSPGSTTSAPSRSPRSAWCTRPGVTPPTRWSTRTPPRGSSAPAPRDAAAGGRGPASGRPQGRPQERPRSGGQEATGYLFVGMGRKAGVRPGDLVGAIANESGLEGRQIGPIRITENFSVVGVPERLVEDIIQVMRGSVIRGKRTTIRRYTDLPVPGRS